MLLNRDRAVQVMGRLNLDALVASSPENVMYGSDYECVPHWECKGLQPFAVLTPGHSPKASLIAPMFGVEAIVEGGVWIDDIYLTGKYWSGPAKESELDALGLGLRDLLHRVDKVETPVDALVIALEKRGLGRGKIGVDERGVTPLVWEQLARRLPNAEIVPAAAIWWDIRAVKTVEELRRLRSSARIAEESVNSTLAIAHPGVRESDVVREYLCQLVRQGALPTAAFFGSGPRTAYPIPIVSDKFIEDGDLVRYDVGCKYRYYHSDTARVYVFGKPKDLHRKIWDLMVQGTEDGIALVRPGANPKDIFEATMKPGRAAGLKNFDRVDVGHGIGLTHPDPPLLKPADPPWTVSLLPAPETEGGLCENMVFCVEVGYNIQGVVGLHCEDEVVVTANGCELLTHNSKHLTLHSEGR